MARIAVVGAGGISQRHVESFSHIENARVVGVVDIAPDRAAALAATCGATPYATLAECLDKADVVYVLTPPSVHKDTVTEALSAGKHVMCEKPLSISLADAQEMVGAASKYQVELMVGFKSRFRRGFTLLRELLESGKLGEPVSFWSQRIGMGVGPGDQNHWRTNPDFICGMSIESLSHDIDLMRWMFGDVRDVCATTFESRPAVPGFDDNAHALLAFESGVTAMIHASWSSHLTMSSRGIVGTRGTAYLEGPALFDNAALHWKTDETPHEVVELINDPNDINGFINENRHFLEVVDRGVTPQVTGADGLRALEVSHAILQSSRENRKVEIKEYSQGGQNE